MTSGEAGGSRPWPVIGGVLDGYSSVNSMMTFSA
jgi:hypothetical protein